MVSTDTRQLPDGCLFFALKGANFDGNQYAAQALTQGAAYAVIDNPAYKTSDRCLLVPNVEQALQRLGRHHRDQFDIPIVGIAGSNGKTTTKELVAAVLSKHHPCHFTKGNFNNHIGVPLTLLAMPDHTEIAVIEMGANHIGELAELCLIARPTHGLLTNIGKEHLEGFGSLEGVKEAEGELYKFLATSGGYIFLNTSEKYLRGMARANRRQIRYGAADNPSRRSNQIEVKLVQETPEVVLAFTPDDQPDQVTVHSQLFGRHNFHNLMTAIAVGVYFKVPSRHIKAALEEYRPANNRSQRLQQGSNTLLMDAYNANPSSMLAALSTLQQMSSPYKVAILGDMRELGADSAKEHAAILRAAAKSGLQQLVLVGEAFGQTNYARYGALHFPNAAAAREWYQQQSFDQALILLKASRGIRLEEVVK